VNPCIITLGTALPSHRYSQEELRVAYHDVADNQLRPRSVRIVDKVFAPSNGIDRRALACAEPRTIAAEGPDELHERFRQHAVQLGTAAIESALRDTEIEPTAIQALVACTCTGYLCPGLSSYLAENLALREDLKVFDLVGMGCGASVPGLYLARQLARSAEPMLVALVSAEVCSATAYFGDDPELIVSNCIFADGAAAAIISNDSHGQDRPALELIDFESSLWPEYRDHLRFRQSHGRLRNCLSRDVPDLASDMADRTLRRLLNRHKLDIGQIDRWAIHPGGKLVLERFAERLNLSQKQLQDSYYVLANYGNMSSPSVLFVLDSLVRRSEWRPGDYVICSAFGAGLSCHAGLFRVRCE